MSLAHQYEIAPEPQETLSLVPDIGEAEAKLKADERNWLINGWQTEMPPEGSKSWEVMRQYNVGLPWRSQLQVTPSEDSPVASIDTVEAAPEPSQPAVIPNARRTGHAAGKTGGGPNDPAGPGNRQLADKLMHVFPNPRRAKILGIVAMRPDGLSSVEIREKLDIAEPDSHRGEGYHRDVLELWLARNGLVESIDDLRSRAGRYWRITAEGQQILPGAGQIVGFAESPGRPDPRIVFGQPQSYRMETADGQPTLGRHRLEQVRYITEHPKEIITAPDLMERTNAGDTATRTLIKDLIDAQWLVVIPSKDREADEYPLLVPGEKQLNGYIRSGFNERFTDYLKEWWTTRGEPVNLHELVHHRTLLRREVAGGPTEFKLAVFQYLAELVSQGYLTYERMPRFPKTYLAANPAKMTTARSILDIVDGTERQTPEYQAAGLQKLFIALQGRTGS